MRVPLVEKLCEFEEKVQSGSFSDLQEFWKKILRKIDYVHLIS